MQIEKIKKIIWILGLLWGIGLVILGDTLWHTWIENGPVVKDESQGVIYPYNDHGRIVYLDSTQRLLYYGLPLAGFAIGGVIGLLSLSYLERRKARSLDTTKATTESN